VDPTWAGRPWTHGHGKAQSSLESGVWELVARVLGGSGGCREPHRLWGLVAGRPSGLGDEAKLRRRLELIGAGLGAQRRGDEVGDGYGGVRRG
jgi:hypothetical protein